MRIESEGCTHLGMKKPFNGDNFSVLSSKNIFIISDGGTKNYGEVASQFVVDVVLNDLKEHSIENDMDKALSDSLQVANQELLSFISSNDRFKGIKASVLVMSLKNKKVVIGHIGNCRVYRIRDRTIELLTKDHSLLNDYLKVHELTSEEIEYFPHKEILTRELGTKTEVITEINEYDVIRGDTFILCTDGLYKMLSDQIMLSITIQERNDIKNLCRELIKQANKLGGFDNITVIAISVE